MTSSSAARRGFARLPVRFVLVTLLCAGVSTAWSATFNLASADIPAIHAAVDAKALSYEKLVQLYLARIQAYDQQGPSLNTVITLNPRALETARELDAEYRARGRRSPLHGIPVLVKDNFDTADLPTTGGAFYLAGSLPPRDGYMIRRLREAGAIVLAKVNLDELAGGGIGFSSLWGQTKNPHALDRIPAGSSGATGAGLASWFAPLGLGTDTGGSIRGPCSYNGVPGIKPTNGLLSRAGIIPRVLSLDTGGPMARTVYDVALSLGFMTGVDPDDALTEKSVGLYYTDYTQFLNKKALNGARIGILREGLGKDKEVDATFNQAVADLKAQGAVIIDSVRYPSVVMEGRQGVSEIIRQVDIREELGHYLATLKPGYPKSLDEMIALHDGLKEPRGRVSPNARLYHALRASNTGLKSTDALYRSAREHGMAMIRDAVMSVMTQHRLDCIVYCTRGEPPAKIADSSPMDTSARLGGSITNIANITQLPDVIVPAGVSHGTLPVSISFLGAAYSEPRLLAYAYAYEQATQRRVDPASTPALPGESFSY
ncbi:MAG: glutamyl-tRNA amidotransferase [Opitutaceae bacterium]|nr:glutamyl-tRNA amidotransferase [Opitutaceae bacterium]